MKKKISLLVGLLLVFMSVVSPNTVFATEIEDNTSLMPTVYVTNGAQLRSLGETLATIDIAKEISDAKNSVIGADVDPAVLENIAVNCSDNEDVTYSVKKLGNVLTRSGDQCSLYTLTAVSSTKTTSDTTDMDNVHAYMSVTWIDNFGVNNELVAVQGGWETERTLYNQTVYYGVDDTTITDYPSGYSFSYTSLGMMGYQIHAVSTVQSKGYDPVISVMIATDILD